MSDSQVSPVSRTSPRPVGGVPLLGAGSVGPEVQWIQTSLKNLGMFQGDVDGKFGPKTRAAVLAFQAKFNLGRDGVVGPATREALKKYCWPCEVPSKNNSPFSTDLLGLNQQFFPYLAKRNDTTPLSLKAPTPVKTTTTEFEVLAAGSKGDAVRKLQRRLDSLGYPLKVDGSFGANTETALRKFQSEYDLEETGKVDAATWKALDDAARTLERVRVVGMGSRGPDVETAQRLLTAAGFTVKADGKFGPSTRDQVIAFQKSKSLSATGVMNTSTWAALASATSPSTSTTPTPDGTTGDLRIGAKGPEVTKLQNMLALAGYPVGTDGKFGQGTHVALIRFQAESNLPATGIADAATIARLEKESASTPNGDWFVYNPGATFAPGSKEQIALFEAAARRAGLPVEWARSRGLRRLLESESGGVIGRPNYTYGTNLSMGRIKEIHRELQAGRKSAKSSATGLGQLLLGNVRTYYPSGVRGIGVPIEEAVGMLRYIKAAYGNPDRAWSAYNSKHEGY